MKGLIPPIHKEGASKIDRNPRNGRGVKRFRKLQCRYFREKKKEQHYCTFMFEKDFMLIGCPRDEILCVYAIRMATQQEEMTN